MTSALLNHRYRVVRALGSGGFGETFLAEDTQMPSGRLCVLKQLRPVTDNPQLYQLVQERFKREAAILERLGESNAQIPRLYAYFTESGLFYLVQEYIEGVTLSEKLHQEGVLSERTVRDMLYSLLPVLQFVHSQGIVHRDVKPDNIILRQRDGLPVLIDFGAVKEVMSTRANSAGNAVSSIAIGTPGFMSSEQAAGRPIYSSDLYSLGLTTIYLLTGRSPQEFTLDPHTGELMWQEYAGTISPGLRVVLDRAVKSHPRDRFPTAADMLTALNPPQFAQNPQTLPPITPPVTSTRTAVVSPTYPPDAKPSVNPVAILGSLAIGGLIGTAAVAGFVAVQNRESPPDSEVVTQEPLPEEPAGDSPKPDGQPEENDTPIATSRPSESFYFLADSAYENLESANSRLDALRSAGYENVGRFWIPDYPNLSDRPLFQVYIDQFGDRMACIDRLMDYGKEIPEAYCALASTEANDPTELVAAADILPREEDDRENRDEKTRDEKARDEEEKGDRNEENNENNSENQAQNRISPEQFVRDYYGLINREDYRNAWELLSEDFRAGGSGNSYDNYAGWWGTVDRVDIRNVREVQREDERAVVRAELVYEMKSGNDAPEVLEIELEWNDETSNWVLDETERL